MPRGTMVELYEETYNFVKRMADPNDYSVDEMANIMLSELEQMVNDSCPECNKNKCCECGEDLDKDNEEIGKKIIN
jgi:hypothetical protein